ncbi:DsrE family protein [Robiginitalea sp. M366]|uniref:DsrE family protein n=1 Tax=Robiginitalea aestuariiviva TaxID=3036903 RepID=UPI00240D57E3|nr:DsrE family protein [Robiginitalea aestuariiviva]MDG1572850.1 DsrE family protein [Robiginitalea aestuariiviva]
MQRITAKILPCLCLLAGATLFGQEKATGPVLEAYGPVWDIPEATFPTETTASYKVVFDVMNSPEDPTAVNPWMETAARFLNMHVRAGVPKEQLHVALVVHNRAAPDLLDNPAYRERFGTDNPNAPMLEHLMEAGVRVVLCGQSSRSRNIPVAQTVPGVELALSAMTALIRLQSEGYQLIKF